MMIRTVLGDIDPQELGPCHMHEHLLGRPPEPYASQDPDLILDDVAAALVDLTHLAQAGGRALVEMTPCDYGRDPAGLAHISAASGIHIIAVTGYLKESFCGDLVAPMSDEQLVAGMIRDVHTGMNDTPYRAGVIKAGSSHGIITPTERRIFAAAAAAHRATGALISTHTEAGTMGQEQVALLVGAGVRPQRILIGHCDRRLERDYHLRLLEHGVTIGFDQIGKHKYGADTERARLIAEYVALGYGTQICISCDIARRSNLRGYTPSAPGFAHLWGPFRELLQAAGVSPEAFQQLTVENPRRCLAFSV